MTTRQDDELAYTLDLPHAPEKVWRALTVPAFLERWLLKPGPGKAGRLAGKARGLERRVEITVLDAEPLRRMSWLWQEEGEAPGCVTVTLTANAGGGTRLDLVHQATFITSCVAVNCNTVSLALAA
jgi:uncharacterized protein YndB with AHSA1/START domain